MYDWFISDHHFGHNNIIHFCERPFSSTQEMNDAMIEIWNDFIRPGDSVAYVGDFALGKRDEVGVVNKLHGDVHLFIGNHDRPFRNSKYITEYLRYGFVSVQRSTDILIEGERVSIGHFPFEQDFVENFNQKYDKFSQFRIQDKGQWLIHGHTHNALRTKWCKQINVCVDLWDFEPVSYGRISSLIKEGPSEHEGAIKTG